MRRPLFVVCLCLVVIIGLSAGRSDWSGLDGTNCIVTGRVYQKDTEYFYLDSIHSIYSGHDAAAPQQLISFTDNLICENDGEPEVLIGSTVRVTGTFDAFSRASNSGEFDMVEYYHSLEIGGKLRNVSILEQGEAYSRLRELLHQIRAYFNERLYDIFPEKEASIMCAMLLGDKKELDADIKHLYQENGIVHILSISGLHITIIGVSVYGLLRKGGFPIWLAAICGGGILLLYGIMTGLSVSACRAIGMYLLRLLSEVVGRTYDMLTALGVMALVVVWSNPGYLHNAGFYLSFGAVLGIGVLYPALWWEKQENPVVMYEERYWKLLAGKLAKKLGVGLKQSIVSGLSVTLMTLPIQLWFYYEIPSYSVLINLFVIPFMSMVMICGLLAMFVPGLGILGTVDYVILQGYEMLCHCFEQLPFHKWNPGKPMWWQVVLYYLILLSVLAVRSIYENCGKDGGERGKNDRSRGKTDCSRGKNDRSRGKNDCICGKNDRTCGKNGNFIEGISADLRKVVAVQILLLTIGVIVLSLRINKKTTVTFLDVGQGDCICVQLESGEVYLFDCGSSSRSQVGEYVLKPFLKYHGIRDVDAIFVSHPDADHCNGVLELLQSQNEWGISVKQLVLPDLEDGLLQEEFGELTAMVNQSETDNVRVLFVKAGDAWSVGENHFLCLHPPKNCALQEGNAYSQCFYIELSGGMSMLLTGDVEAEGEDILLEELEQRNIEDISLLKVAHHGSKYSTEEDFLEQVQPHVAVISCGVNNSYGHPHEDTLERLEEVGCVIVTTPECGAITVELEQQPEVRGWK